jgi:hypothetical protein
MRSSLYDNISKRLRIAANPSLRQRYLNRLVLKKRSETCAAVRLRDHDANSGD